MHTNEMSYKREGSMEGCTPGLYM